MAVLAHLCYLKTLGRGVYTRKCVRGSDSFNTATECACLECISVCHIHLFP